MNNIFVPAMGLEDWKRLLARPYHWKDGRSAKELATLWHYAQGFPDSVKQVLQSSDVDDLRNLELLMAFPEYRVPLPGGSRSAQSDVFVLARSPVGLVTMTVEGKVDEGFDVCAGQWLKDTTAENKGLRLDYLCEVLGVAERDVLSIHYQLLHRTASALIEADRFNAPIAVMLVHSFSAKNDGFDDFSEFARLMGAEPSLNGVVEGRPIGKRRIILGWVREAM